MKKIPCRVVAFCPHRILNTGDTVRDQISSWSSFPMTKGIIPEPGQIVGIFRFTDQLVITPPQSEHWTHDQIREWIGQRRFVVTEVVEGDSHPVIKLEMIS